MSRTIRLVTGQVLVAAVAGVLVVLLAGTAGAAPQRQGEVVVVSATERSKELLSGDSSGAWTLRLPSGAACPGDSMNDDWRVQSFIVPASAPVPERWRGIGPAGSLTDEQWSLYQANTEPYSQEFTLANGGPGEPGLIDLIPPLSFQVMTPELLPPGRWRMGIACSLDWATATYWDTEIDLAADPDVQPGGLRWQVVQDPNAEPDPSGRGGSSGSLPIAVALAAVAAVAVVVLARRRAHRPQGRTPTLEGKDA